MTNKETITVTITKDESVFILSLIKGFCLEDHDNNSIMGDVDIVSLYDRLEFSEESDQTSD